MSAFRRGFAASATAAATLLVAATDAHAWCRTTTNRDFVQTTAKPCDDIGYPLYWASSQISYDVQQDASVQVTLATARAQMAAAFARWSAVGCPADPVACTGPSVGHPTISAVDFGPASCSKVEYNKTTGNANIIMFRDSNWPHSAPGATLALTTVTFDTTSGELYDADMEINSDPARTTLTMTDPPARVEYDLASIVTHEAGHFLGLAHTQPNHTDSTMFISYNAGETFMRDPHADDACGLCAIYPPSRSATCNSLPRHGFALGCGGDAPGTPPTGACVVYDDTSKGCHCAMPGAPNRPLGRALALVGVALASVAISRRRRR